MADIGWNETNFSPPEDGPEQAQRTRDVWYGIANNETLKFTVEELGEKVTDFDGRFISLHLCNYTIGGMGLRRLVKKGMDEEALRRSYSFISRFRHPAAIIVENHHCRGSLVMSTVHGTFRKWLKNQAPSDLFLEGSMLPLLRNMIIDLAEVVQAVHDQSMYIVDLSMKDLYIKILDDGHPRIQVLVTDAREATNALQIHAWGNVKEVVELCFEEHGLKPNRVTESFCAAIASKPAFLKNFPDQWDSSEKSTFLVEKCAYKVFSSGINKSGLEWPMKDGTYEPLVLELIKLGAKYAAYDFRFPNDYVRLCRNTYKHFYKLPPYMKTALGGNTNGFLRKMEEWSPNIWAILYAATEPKH